VLLPLPILTAAYHMLRMEPCTRTSAPITSNETLPKHTPHASQAIARLGFNCTITPASSEEVVSV